MEPKEYFKRLHELLDASFSSYDFIKTCYLQGIVSFKEANKAMNKVHKQFLKDLNALKNEDIKAYKKQFMNDRKLEVSYDNAG